MRLKQEIKEYISTLIFVLAGVTNMLAQNSNAPLFDAYSNTHQYPNGHYFLCDAQDSENLRIMALNEEAQLIGNINAEIYENASDIGNTTKALAVFTNELPKNIKYAVKRSVINPDNEPLVSKSYFVRITPADGSEGVWTEEVIFDAVHIEDVTIPEIEPFCSGQTATLMPLFTKYSRDPYNWYYPNGDPLMGLGGMMTILNLGEGSHNFVVKVKKNQCTSLGTNIVIPVLGNNKPKLNINVGMAFIIYDDTDIKRGRYTNSITEQVKMKLGVDELIDNPNDCKLIWSDPNGNIIDNIDNYIPDVPERTDISKISVKKDCGCGSISEPLFINLLRIVIPKPTVEDLEFCVGDALASNGFDANINSDGSADEAPYRLEFSENEDMRDSVVLEIGQTHFNYTFDVSEPTTKTFYVRQQKIARPERNEQVGFSEAVPFNVVVRQPETPTLINQSVCANSTQNISLSSISNESNLIWKDENDNSISTSVPVKKRGDFTVSAQKVEILNGAQCASKTATATIHVDSLDVKISGADILLPGQTGKAEVEVKSSANATFDWSSDISNAIISDANKKEVTIKMGTSDVTLNANVIDGECSQSVNWTIQADLFQCPRPSADDITFCLNDPRVTDGFDANITLENNSDNISNYVLSVSSNSDMSDATTLNPGETHFNYTFDASAVGTKTIFIQQTELSRNLSSAIVPVTISIVQPDIPSAHSAAICINNEEDLLLSDLSTKTNLQWYDEERNMLTNSAHFTTKGSHPLYLKQYEMVNGEKCWSELATVNITVDSIGIKLSGDNHLCPDGEGQIKVEATGSILNRIDWTSDTPNSISNTTNHTVNVKMGNSNIKLSYSALAGVCESTGTWEITVGTGKVSGKIKFTEGDKVRESNSLSNVEFIGCGGKVSVEAIIEHTSPEFSVRKGNKDLGTYSFVGDEAKFEVEGSGTYSVIYENDCETSFSFEITTMSIQPALTTSKWSSCYGGYISAEISNVDGCQIVWKKDDVEIAKDNKTLKVSNVTASDIGNYSYHLVCDGCPADGDVSTTKPDIYSPLTITTTQSADTICQKDEVEVEIGFSPNSDKVSFHWSNDDDINISNEGASATLSPYVTKSYNVVVKNGDCEAQTKTIKVNVHPQMDGNIEAGSIMCEGDSTQIDASSLEAERYEWEHTDSESPIITVVPNGVENTYTVTAYRGKCVLEKDFTLMVGATPKLASVDSIGLDDVMINMETAGDYKFIVDGKDKSIDVADNVKKHVGFGKHTLSIIDIAGCKTDTSFFVVEPPLEIQDYIKPNSDGKDATFRIPDAVIVYPGTTMNIYDRWGKKLATLKSSDEEGWDGTYNGKPMPSADYWYDLNVDAIDKTYFGHFTLVRE